VATKSDKAKTGGHPIGYRNPPKHSQFRKGQSGNPRGRPKGARNFATVLEHALMDKVIANENGQRKAISKLEALVMQMINKAISGDARARQQTLGVMHILEESSPGEEAAVKTLDETEKQLRDSILSRMRGVAVPSDEPE